MADRHSAHAKQLGKLSNNQRRQQRIDTFRETRQIIEQLSYTSRSNNNMQIDEGQLTQGIQSNQIFRHFSELNCSQQSNQPLQIKVYQGDCLEAAQFFTNMFPGQVCILNMASACRPGGGVKNGAGAQEENLFRRSNYFQHLYPRQQQWYPMNQTGGIYSPGVFVFRDSEAENYALLDSPYFVNCIAVPAIRQPSLVQGKYSAADEDLMRQKIRMILAIASHFQQKIVVLSAFGCGAYRNPAIEVARLFKEEIESQNWGFDQVVFAIFDDHNAYTQINPQGNVIPFGREFGVEIKASLSDLMQQPQQKL